MQCRYCGADNPDTVRKCVSCNQPIHAAGTRNAYRPAGYLYVGREGEADLLLPQIGSRTRVQTLRRTRRLTGSTMPKSTTVKRPETGRMHSPRTPQANINARDGGKARPEELTAQGRTEPSWTEPAASPHAMVAHGVPDPAIGTLRASPKRKVMRLLLMAGIFVVGAGAGLIGAWWINEPSVIRAESAANTSPPPTAVTVRTPAERPPGAKVRGINPSELPYDGAAPPEPESAERQPAPAEPAVAKRQAPRVAPLQAETSVKSAPAQQSSGASHSEPTSRESGNGFPEENVGLDESQRAGLREPSMERSRDLPEAGNADARAELPLAKPPVKAANQAREVQDDVERKSPAAQKRAAPTKSAKDREIERIRQQAEDELKKKPESGRLLGRSRGKSPSARHQSRRQESPQERTASAKQAYVRASLARCERAPNFFRREQCKWRVCGGAWGKNGCPYYPPHATNTY